MTDTVVTPEVVINTVTVDNQDVIVVGEQSISVVTVGIAGVDGQGVAAGGTTGQVLAKASNTSYDTEWIAVSGTGTVTSVGLTVPTGLTVSGSPITVSGTIAVSLSSGYVIPTQAAIDAKVTANAGITGATKTKVTYDAKGLVIAGADATTADIADSSNKRYVTDAQLVVIGNTSNTNTGDNAVNSLYSGLVSNATHTGDATGATALTLATVNSNVGTFGSATQVMQQTVNAKGLTTAASNVTIAIPSTQVTDFTEAAQDAVGGILTDSSEIDFTYSDATPSITAAIVAGSIDETKLDTSVNASLDLADSAVQLAFKTIAVSGQSDVVADSATDTLTLAGGAGITITTNAGTDTVTISSTGGAVSDADYGDITVSSTGAVWTIDNGVVTLAKLADVATATVFYRKTAGTGVPEVQTLATLKTDLGLTGTNSGDQTSIVGITGTKAQFDTAVSDGNILYVGDVTQYTDEMAQDAVGAMVNTSLTYTDGTPLLALTSRTINGVAYDGTANITVTAAAGTLTGTVLNATVVDSSLTSVGAQAQALNMNSHLINNVTDPSSAQDAATKAYVDNAVLGLLDYRGSYDASTNLFPATGGSGTLGAILKGDFWICSVAGTLGGESVTAGDLIIAIVDTPAQTAANWDLIEHNIGTYVVSVSGTANRITSTGGATPVIDVSSSLWATTPSTTKIWDGTAIASSYVGLGNVTNDTQTKAAIVPNTAPSAGQILAGNAGGTAYAPATVSGSGATISLASTGVMTISAIANATLSNSAITIAGTSTALGGSITQDTITGLSSTGIIKRTGANTLAVATSGTDYSAGTSALATGILKSTTTTGALTIAVAGDFPTLNQNTTGSAATLTTTRTLWGQNFNGSANVTGDITLGTANITMTGSLAATGARVTKGWFTDIESTNMPTVGGTSLSSTFQPLDSDLTTIAGLTATTDNFIQSKSSAWASRTPTQVTADLIAMVGDSGAGGTKGLVPAPASGDAAAGKFLKADGTWATAGGGSPAFSAITGATNTTAAMVVGTGASLAVSGSGTIAATTSVALATGRTIAITGDLTYTSPSFDGTGNVTAAGTIANNAITFAKMQAVSANILLGNDATGTAVEEITCTAAGRALLDDADASAQRTTLGLGTLATQSATITDYLLSATAASTYQPLDSDLTTIAGLTATTDNFIVSVASAWASRTPAQVRTTLGLVIGTNVQAYDADLTTWAGITPGTGVGTALAINVGSAGAFVTFNGAGGTPSSLTGTNITGTAAGLTAGNVTTNANLTGAVTSSGNATTLVSALPLSIPGTGAANQTIYADAKAAFGYTINSILGAGTSSGSITLAVKINGTNVTGLSAVSITSTPADTNATAANVVAAGDTVTWVFTSNSSAVDLRFNMKITRT